MPSNVICSTRFGLTPTQYQQLVKWVLQDTRVQRAWIFGSRALGTFKDGSDIDLALEGEALTLHDIAMMLANLEQSTLPFKVDLLLKEHIGSPELLAHIRQHGVQVK